MKYKPDHPSARQFLKNVAQHQLTIIRDDGVDRHLRFKRPESGIERFDLITWPGTLCYTGDMGTFVFSRIPDMFEFFRDEKSNGHLRINTQYWSEKLDAADRRTGGYQKFVPDLFRQRVMRYARESGANRATQSLIKDRVLVHADDGEQRAYQAACDFEHGDFCLHDFWEIDCRDYTYHFVWCCYAIVWGIKQYDALKTKG